MAVLWNVWPTCAGSRVSPPSKRTASSQLDPLPKCSPTEMHPMRPMANRIVRPYAYPSRFVHRTDRLHLRNVGEQTSTAAMNPPENCNPPFYAANRSRGQPIWLQGEMSHVMRAP